ncbi:hypothetical protein NX059_012343 [Plenodomus lindquistii]|nr:hypothetical protein NX059_012343 [Plenodomus lindquistii]
MLTQYDSFADLVPLMRAKMSSAPISPATSSPQLVLGSDSNDTGHETVVNSKLSLLSTPFRVPESVAEFLEREEYERTNRALPTLAYHESTTQHLESLFEDMKKNDFNSTEIENHVRVPSPHSQSIPSIPQFESLVHFANRDLPTPTDSYRRAPSPFLSDTEPVVRSAKHVYDSLAKDLENMGKEKQELQEKVKKLEHECRISREDDNANGTRLGLRKYQKEANRTLTADMGYAFNDMEVKIKLQRLDINELRARLKRVEMGLQAVGERDYFRDTLSSVRDEHTRALEEMTASKDQAFHQAYSTIRDLQATLTKITAERNAASQANLLAGNYAA